MHYTEADIERMLRSRTVVRSEREAFETHMAACASCKELYEELGEYYAALDREGNRVLPGRGRNVSAESRLLGASSADRMPAVAQRAWMTVRRSPMTSAAVGFVSLGALAFSLTAIRPSVPDQPARAVPIDTLERVEILSDTDALLWWIPSHDFWPQRMGDWFGFALSAVVDLDQDGTNEVVTILPPGPSTDVQNAMVRVLRSDGKEIRRWELSASASVAYDSTRFFRDWRPRSLEVYRNAATGEWRILAAFVHEHSPSFVVRLDREARELGQFWSFGHLNALTSVDLNRSGSPHVVTYGLDDEIAGAHITVLDPEQIQGVTASVRSPGYAYARSTAEVRIFRIPYFPCAGEFSQRLGFLRVWAGRYSEASVAWGMWEGTHPRQFASFVVDSTLEVVSVTPTDGYIDFAKGPGRTSAELQSKEGLARWVFRNMSVWNGVEWKTREMMP